ncbi:hypothetical protein [Methylobacterium sp. J-092]|uniref:hypothetical protein n=1 Tax=Methylobacterium sp. J-092 TaxID=2836667 RepID=UPI001FBBC561|nr:hypothetical protein [Methylobacterium sp. J-092]MCJ2006746.1 hypothetical protein [Methylobacterium sp. J-092]
MTAVQDHIERQGWTPAEVARILSDAPPEGECETARRLQAQVVEAARDRLDEKGYTPTEIAQNLPSVRREFVKRFMSGRELVSLD